MPGQAVGSGVQFNTVGNQFPQAGSKVGQPLNVPPDTPLMRRSNPNDPFDAFRGSKLDPKSVARAVSRLGSECTRALLRQAQVRGRPLDPAILPKPEMVTPGIFRRNRERAQERRWRQD